jgi:predicted ArsR family transcriptional regulator
MQSLIAGIADPVRLEVIQFLTRMKRATAAQLGENCAASTPTLRRHLGALVAIGVIIEEAVTGDGVTPGRPATSFSLTPEMHAQAVSVICAESLRPAL